MQEQQNSHVQYVRRKSDSAKILPTKIRSDSWFDKKCHQTTNMHIILCRLAQNSAWLIGWKIECISGDMQRGHFINPFDQKRLIWHLFCSTYWSRSLIIFNHLTIISMDLLNCMTGNLHSLDGVLQVLIYWHQFVIQGQIASKMCSSLQ